MQTLSSRLNIDKNAALPVYLQLSNQLMVLIKAGTLQAGYRLPSTRQLAYLLTIHRKTVIRAYDELLAQGWLESKTGNGTFVAHHLPVFKPQTLANKAPNTAQVAGFNINTPAHLYRKTADMQASFHLDDGFPDVRMAPVLDMSRAYRTQLLTGNPYTRLGYGDTSGSAWLRDELAAYLNVTRGLHVTAANILIVRGTVMGLYLACTGLLQAGDTVVTGEPGWTGAQTNFLQAGANLLTIPVDDHGLNVDLLEQLCLKQTVRLVYVTSHHHYPTTVGLRADRRVQLLALAQKYGFIIFEDDYDYDFHYQNKPLMPLASADEAGMVLYCGSFSKTISPAIRVGYLVGPQNVIEHLSRLRRLIDRQGDTLLENAMAELLQNGIIQRHLRKSLRVYRQRRDIFCDLMKTYLGNQVQFKIPDGGLAVWTHFDPQINLTSLAQKALKKGLYFQGENSAATPNATRLGFASSTPDELQLGVEILAKLLQNP
ncbi:PLP-dependent aminotransferase family protein [Mucilaginibacter sp. SP1R1]|uniref:MocR-like pyridoxine biosynthesis transcription factor PdxR n=1 Tax=Mucilaginibacter sp. SP1R1 TaxID=2723091 RepID=UPI00160FFBCE|nr:PLP-dependent aminotransferase family protein [Mucilaginibacter sp. SP1R1]MBB6152513.1 GntR family transcriptional regulator/MocR family aminotransferase [Mucilaginibacter sp. SP1R1]